MNFEIQTYKFTFYLFPNPSIFVTKYCTDDKNEARLSMFQLREKLRGFLLLLSTHRCLEIFSRPGKARFGRLGIFRGLRNARSSPDKNFGNVGRPA